VTETIEPPGWLIDKSALVRLGRSPDRDASGQDFDLVSEITGQTTERLTG
jgi:hypothetical protein